jgi:hypothetical protein
VRTFTSISLVALLLLNLFGFYFAFVVRQSDIRKDVVESISKGKSESLEVFSFSRQEFNAISWLVEGREFEMNGKRYDVVKTEISTNSVELYVENDVRENTLVNDFVSLINTQSEKDQTNSPLKIMLEHFLKEFTQQSKFVMTEPVMNSLRFGQLPGQYLLSWIDELQSPPPQTT